MTEEQVFLEALEIDEPTARTAYLDKACGNDSAFRRQVNNLLAAHYKSGEFLDQPLVQQLAAPDTPNNDTISVSFNSHCEPAAKEPKTADELDDLHFLQLSTRPDSLGRIGHYEVLQVLGRGGFGIVFRALDEVLQRVVALKVLAPAIAATSPARKRFLREARSSAQVRHENVVQVYEVVEQPLPYLAMEFIPGETLQQRLDRHGPLEVPDILHISRQIAEGLAAAHETSLIHRDIKPGNVLIENGPYERVKITDFGLARAADDASMTQSGVLAGTPMYMAPEQAKGDMLDHRGDLFSLGSVMYVMATGRPPFRAATTFAVLKRVVEEEPRSIQEIIPEVPRWLCDIIARLQAKNPDNRFQTAREVADLLADCEAKLKAKQEVKPIGPVAIAQAAAPVARSSSTGRGKWLAAAAILLLPIVALGTTELTGVTHLFRGQKVVPDPINPVKGPTPIPVAKAPENANWVQLFNGKDLTNWTTKNANCWSVAAGSIVGEVPVNFKAIKLHSEREDYQNFKLRVECKASEGTARLWLRASQELDGYQIFLSSQDKRIHPGSVCRGVSSERTWLLEAPRTAIPPDTWFTVECDAVDHEITVRVNGKEVGRAKDAAFGKGGIKIDAINQGAAIHVRKIEIVELPSGAVTPEVKTPTVPVATAVSILKPFEMISEGGATLKMLEDSSILVSGEHPAKDSYTLTARNLPAKIQALRLEVLPHSSLPNNGPGRHPSGEFVLSTIKAHIDLPKNPGGPRLLKIAKARADNSTGDDSVEGFAIDDDDNTGWKTEVGKPHFAVFELAEPVIVTEGMVLSVTLEFKWEGEKYQLGCFRLSAAVDAKSFKDADLKRIGALPATEQVEEVRKELMRRNPGFDGDVKHKIEDDVVTEIRFLTDQVTDIAPLRIWSALRVLDLHATHTNDYKGNGQLADLSPLAGMNLAGLKRLNLSFTMVGDAGLVHFKDCTNLTYLNLEACRLKFCRFPQPVSPTCRR